LGLKRQATQKTLANKKSIYPFRILF
jgi:hypothetical protein